MMGFHFYCWDDFRESAIVQLGVNGADESRPIAGSSSTTKVPVFMILNHFIERSDGATREVAEEIFPLGDPRTLSA
jgi:hypothetical protein